MSALVRAQEMAVQPHARGIIDGAEMQNRARAFRGVRKFFLVPTTMVKTGIADSARGSFGCERNLNFKLPARNFSRLFEFFCVVEKKVPLAVERRPIFPSQLLSGVIFHLRVFFNG